MQSAKQKVSDMASATKEKIQIAKAKVEEEAQQATARTKEEKEIAKEVRKVKEAEAKADLHAAKAKHAADKLESKQAAHHYHIPGTGIVTGTGHHLPSGTGQSAPASNVIGTGNRHYLPGTGGHQLGGTLPPRTTNTTSTTNFQGYTQPYNKHI